VSEENYRHYLDDMLYTHAGDDRSVTGPEHDPARDNIQALLTSFGLTVTLESFAYEYPEPGTGYNVVATKLGTTYPDQEYIIGAHYDSGFVFSEHGKPPQFVEPEAGYQGTPGADDNGSGVALILEAARILSQYDSDYTIRFIAFDAEEVGLVGSEAYVADHIDDDILGMISTDMVAYDDGRNEAEIWCGSDSSPDVRSDLAEAITSYGEGLGYLHFPSSGNSDYAPFEDAGFQACLLMERSANPYYHELQDNVDVPGYINYEYATRMTRSIVGFLVDNAGVHVDIPDADYDVDGDVDDDDFSAFTLCFTGADTPPVDPDCYFFDFDSDGDIDCDDWGLFAVVWTGPPVDPPFFFTCAPGCFPSSMPEPETLFEPTGRTASAARVGPISVKNRYLSVWAGDTDQTKAIRVTAVSLPSWHDIWNDQIYYAGPPIQVCENSGQSLDVDPQVPYACGPAPEQPQDWFWVAPLLCDGASAHFTDWTTLADYCNAPEDPNNAHPCTSDADCGTGTCGVDGVIHLYHEAIVPSHMATSTGPVDVPAEYDIQVIGDNCGLDSEGAYSDPLRMIQAGWADVVKDVTQCPSEPPEESVSVVTDVIAILNKFSNNPCAPKKTRADLEPHSVDFKISISDVTRCLGAFVGDDYPFGAGHCIDHRCSGGPDHGIPGCITHGACSSDPCTLGVSRELGEKHRKRNLPLVDAERDGGPQ
jgi:hypothetical protein